MPELEYSEWKKIRQGTENNCKIQMSSDTHESWK
jgi:hypothetical protein